MENVQLWWGIIGGIITAGVAIVGSIIGIKKYKNGVIKQKAESESMLFEQIKDYFDDKLEANRKEARAEKKIEALEQQKFCSARLVTTNKVEKRVNILEESCKVTALGINILVKSQLKEKINGDVEEYKDRFDKYFIGK